MAIRKKLFGEGGLSGAGATGMSAYATYYNSVLLLTDWATLEPRPGMYQFAALDNDIAALADARLNVIVAMKIQPKQYSPLWLFNPPYSVPAVSVVNSANVFGYYFDSNGYFRQRFYRMLDTLCDHLIANGNVAAIQLLEGFELAASAYNGATPIKSKFIITFDEYTQWQKDAWNHVMSYVTVTDDKGETIKLLEVFINPLTNNDTAINYILANLPYAWIRSWIEGTDYSYNLELFDWDNINNVLAVKKANANSIRKRCELSGTPDKSWFQQAYNKNMMQVALHALTKGNDIWTFNNNAFIKDSSHIYLSTLFNELAGNNLPKRKKAIAWWAPNGKIDGANTTRFPPNTYGTVLNDGSNSSVIASDYVTKANINRLIAIRNAMNCKLIITQFGSGANPDKTNDDKYLNDIGMKVYEEPLGRWITQPDWLNESKYYWRIGNVNDYWGRYAVGFKAPNGKLYYKLDDDFKINLDAITLTIIFLNKGNTQWRVQNVAGTNIMAKTMTNRNVVESAVADIDNFQSGQLPNGNDIVIEHFGGDYQGVKFVFLKINKKGAVPIQYLPPNVNAGADLQITGTSQSITGTVSDPNPGGSIASHEWQWELDQDGLPIYPAGATPVIESPTALTTVVSGMTVLGAYKLILVAINNFGVSAWDERVITKVNSIVGPTANAGPNKTIKQGDPAPTIGGTDTAGTFAIDTRSYATTDKPAGAANPTFGSPSGATTTVIGLVSAGASAGSYTIVKTVDDGHGNTDTDDVVITVNPTVIVNEGLTWGGFMSGTELTTEQKIALSTNLNFDILRSGVTLKEYTTPQNEKFLMQIKASNGKTAAIHTNWEHQGGSALDFVTGSDLESYLNRLDGLLAYFKSVEDGGIIEFVAIENEPDNAGHYSGTTDNTNRYIELVRRAIIICHNRNTKICDGCIHVQNATGNSGRVGAIKAAYSNEWANIDFVNIHGYYPRDSAQQWQSAANAMKNAKLSNQKIITNECGLKNPNSENTIIPDEAEGLVNIIKNNGFRYAILLSDEGKTAKPFNITGTANRNANGDRFIATI